MTLTLRDAFRTPIYTARIDSAAVDSEALLSDIEAWRAEHPKTTQRSSFGGAWHSPTDAFLRTAFHPLCKAVLDVATQVYTRERYVGRSSARLELMWANVLPPGGYHVPHTHGASLWSGVYYVQVPDGSPGIQFLDPRPSAGIIMPTLADGSANDRMSVPAEAGQLIMFPAWLQHYVDPHAGESERVSVSFNLRQHVKPDIAIQPPRTDETPNWIAAPSLLTKAECRKIVNFVSTRSCWSPAAVGSGTVDPSIRKSGVIFLDARAETSDWHWLYRRLLERGQAINAESFGVDISGGISPFQITRYQPGEFYEAHLDVGDQAPRRTLSCAVTLKRGAGGRTDFPEAQEQAPTQTVGDAVFFRADERHGAKPVTGGERITLIAWFEKLV